MKIILTLLIMLGGGMAIYFLVNLLSKLIEVIKKHNKIYKILAEICAGTSLIFIIAGFISFIFMLGIILYLIFLSVYNIL